MIDIDETIEILENEAETLVDLSNLASLYIVRDKRQNRLETLTDSVEKELGDILPSYRRYCDAKRGYQLGELPDIVVLRALATVLHETEEFLTTLYRNTDLPKERQDVKGMLKNLQENLK